MKIRIIACIITALFLLGSASIWEGAGAVSLDGVLPASGFFAATNSFPRNTVVDITNLENNKTIRVIVASGLDTPGLLAMVSKEAADSIGMSGSSISRIRMTQPSDPIAFSRFTEGLASGIPDYDSGVTRESLYDDPRALSGQPRKEPEPAFIPPTIAEGDRSPAASSYFLESEWDERPYPEIVDLDNYKLKEPKEDNYLAGPEAAPVPVEDEPAAVAVIPHENPVDYDYRLIPTEERPPTLGIYDIDPESIIPGISLGGVGEADVNRDYINITDFLPSLPQEPVFVESASPFPVPLISGLERGSYYVQLGAFNRAELIESQISRIDRSYPLVVFNAGSGERPVYRILLGPLNHGESGALLQRFKSIGYTDAFIRQGS